MELRQLRAFVHVTHAGTFTRAAEELHLTQSAVSTAVGKLEAELGFELLRRTARGVELTEAGEAVFERAREIVASADAIRSDLAAMRGLLEGTVALGTMLPPRIRGSRCGCARAARPTSSPACGATSSTSPSPASNRTRSTAAWRASGCSARSSC
jgi:DNA-binding MarR family transcriptional regulator